VSTDGTFMTVIHLGEVIRPAAARDEGDKNGEKLSR
jgi:hypothetical protein